MRVVGQAGDFSFLVFGAAALVLNRKLSLPVSRMGEDNFVAMRVQRDASLSVPKLLLPSIQVNIRAGHFDEAQSNGVTYLRIPVKWKKRGGSPNAP